MLAGKGGQHLMTRPYSLDLRERVVAAVAAGQTCRSVASTFSVSVASVVKWSQRMRVTGTVAAGKVGGHRRYILEPERDWLLRRVEEDANLTLQGVRAELAERGTVVSCDTLWRFLRREGISFKKNRARQRAGAAGRGAATGAVEEVSGEA
jgi:transposase